MDQVDIAVANFKHWMEMNPTDADRLTKVIETLNDISVDRLDTYRQSAKLLESFITGSYLVTHKIRRSTR